MATNPPSHSVATSIALGDFFPREERLPSWCNSLQQHGLVQTLQKQGTGGTLRISLFGGSPRWWLEAPTQSKTPLLLLGLMHDASGKAYLFQLAATQRLGRIQLESLATAVRNCPTDVARPLRDIGELRRPSSGQELLGNVSRSTAGELLALLDHAGCRPEGQAATRLKQSVTRAIGVLVRQFETRLDGDLLLSSIACPVARYRHYNHLIGMPDVKRQRFAQASRALPFCYGLAAGPDPVAQRIAAAICAGGSVYASLRDALGAPEWIFRALRHAYAYQQLSSACSPVDRSTVLELINAMTWIDPNRLPSTAQGWDYLICAHARLPVPRWIADLSHEGFDALATGTGLSRKMAGWRGRRGLNGQVAIIRDYLDYAGQLADPAFPPPPADAGFRQVWEQARRWRQIVPRDVLEAYWNAQVPNWLQRPSDMVFTVDAGGIDATQTWAQVAAETVIQDGFEFHELTSSIALREEGFEMGHCVGGYAYQCLQRASHIFSIRHSGKRLATMELRATPVGTLQIVQIKGPRNRVPDPTLVTSASRMVAQLNCTLEQKFDAVDKEPRVQSL